MSDPTEPRIPPHRCGKCDARWGGANRAHCSACHRTFGGITPFDKHRIKGSCVHPIEQGMTENAHGIWGYGEAEGKDWTWAR